MTAPASLPETTDRPWYLFVTACEGGVNYWARVREYRHSLPGTKYGCENEARRDLQGFRAVLEDAEDSAKRYELTRAVIERGLLALRDQRCTFGGKPWPASVKQWAAAMSGDYDATTADVIVQAGLFGDVRYG